MAPEVDSDDENVEYEDDSGHRYRLYLDELEDSSTAPPSNSSASLQGTSPERQSPKDQSAEMYETVIDYHTCESVFTPQLWRRCH